MEKIIVYIAGNPDAYPLEYYDGETWSYQGVIPALLRRFSEQSRYDVRYYASGGEDRRTALAANRQVDMISCPENVEAIRHRAGEDILLLEDVGDGQAAVLCLLDVAPDSLAGDLRAFLSGVSQRELTGLVLQAVHPPQDRRLTGALLISLALTAALAAALVCGIVSSRRRLKKLRQEKDLDPVTGIGNREYLERCCRTFLNDRNRVLYTLFYFCVAPSSPSAGEAVFPRHMAAVLQDCAGDADILARVSDNGFALLRLSPGERDSEEWLSAALYRLRETYQEGSGPMPGISVGVCPLKADDRDWNEILLRGLQTAQIAWRKGVDYQFFRDDILNVLHRERRLRADARSGLQNREFQTYLQFFADARTGRAAGAKVTLLWEHPALGPLPASRWLSLLEEEGLSGRLDGYVLERMCAFLDHLRQNGREDFFLLYSLSGKTLSSERLEDEWKEILAGYRFDYGRLLFGVPQDAALGRGTAAGRGADAIRSMGMGLVLDGFDGRITRLAQAGDASFHGLKIGQELTGQTETASGQAALETMFRFGHKLNLIFLAEDVASKEQAARLRQSGCDLLCGTLYAHPLPVWEAMKKLTGQAKEEGRTKVV